MIFKTLDYGKWIVQSTIADVTGKDPLVCENCDRLSFGSAGDYCPRCRYSTTVVREEF